MDAVEVWVGPDAGRAIGRDADRFKIDAIGGAGRHGRHQRHPGEVFRAQRFDRADHLGVHRRGLGQRMVGVVGGHRHPRIVEHFDKRCIDFGERVAGKDAAIDDGAGALRQRVGGVAAVEHRRNAGGAQRGMQAAVVVEQRHRGFERVAVGGGAGHGLHGLAHRAAARGSGAREKGAGGVVQFGGKLVRAQPQQRIGQLIDRVVADGNRAVAARVAGFDAIILRRLFADLHAHRGQMPAFAQAFAVGHAAAAFIDGKFGIDQIAPVLGQPVGAIERTAGFLAAGQRQFQCAAQLHVPGFEPRHGVDPDRGHRLVIKGATGPEIAIFLDQGKRIAGPVGALGLDHVDMRKQQDRFLRVRCAGQHRNQPAIARVFGGGVIGDLIVGKAGRLQPRAHALRRQRAAAGRHGGIGFHQFLVGRAKRRLGRVVGGQRGGRSQCAKRGAGQNACDHQKSPRMRKRGSDH